MVHRFLEHNLVVIALKAAYLDGKTKGKTLEKDKSEEASVAFSSVAVSVLPKEVRDWKNVQKNLSQPDIVGEEPIVLSIKETTLVDLIKTVWLHGYFSSSCPTLRNSFEEWVRALNKNTEELDREAYEVVFEVIRKETSLLSCSEYKPTWALMVEEDCSIGAYNVDILNVGDFIEYTRHEVCKVMGVNKNTHIVKVCRIECKYSDGTSNRIFEPRCNIPVVLAAGDEHGDKIWGTNSDIINNMLNSLSENKKVTKVSPKPTIKNPKKVNRKVKTVIVNNRPIPKN